MATTRILVIESDEDFANSLVSMFNGFDAELNIIGDGKSGLQVAKQEPPDLILLCVELPKMSGYSVCNKLKKDKKLKSVPLVVMSAEATEETFEQHKKLKTRADEYIIKPFTVEQIVEKVTGLAKLPKLAAEDEEYITIGDDEAINIDESDEHLIAEMPDLEDGSVDLEDDESTVVMDSPLMNAEGELDSFEEVFDDMQMEEDPVAGEADIESDPELIPDQIDSDEFADFEDVLDSIKEEDLDEPVSVPQSEDLDAEVAMVDEMLEVESDELISELDEVAAKTDENDLEMGLDADLDDMELPADLEDIEDLEAGEEDDFLLEAPGEEEISEEVPELTDSEAEAIEDEIMEAAEDSVQEQVIEEDQAEAPARVSAAAVSDPVLATKLQNAESDCTHLRDKVLKLEQRLEEAHQAYQKRESEAADFKRDASKDKEFLALKNTINAKDRELLDLREEINSKEQEVLDAREKIGERDNEIQNQQEVVASRDREIKEQSDAYETLLRQKNELEELHQGKMTEWEDRYSGDTAKLEQNIQSLQEEKQQAGEAAQEDLQKVQDEVKALQKTMEDTKQRHGDEVYGLRTRYKNEIEKLDSSISDLQSNLDETSKNLSEERSAHEQTKEAAATVPQLEEDLASARSTVADLETEVSNLKEEVANGEDRMVKAYQKIKNDEKIKEKARKAVEIAFTLLADQVDAEEEGDDDELAVNESDHDEAHT